MFAALRLSVRASMAELLNRATGRPHVAPGAEERGHDPSKWRAV